MDAKNTPPTLNEVAIAAGVSSATVSRYFNKPDAVAKSTAERIKQAVLATGYTPNLVAGSLASNKSRLVSILIPQLSPSILTETIEAIVHQLSAAGNVVTVGITEFDAKHTSDLIRAAISYRAKAIVITADLGEDDKKLLRQSNISTIQIWSLPDDPIDIAIGFSHYEIGSSLASFIKERGYVRPHFITNKGPRAIKRREGFVDQWQKLDMREFTEQTLELPLKYEYSRSAFAQIKRMPQLPDVVICGSDWLAQGIIIEAHAFGYKVPGDLAVIGFGNNSIASGMRPTMTTIDVDDDKISRLVVETLSKKDQGIAIDQPIINTGFKIVARESA